MYKQIFRVLSNKNKKKLHFYKKHIKIYNSKFNLHAAPITLFLLLNFFLYLNLYVTNIYIFIKRTLMIYYKKNYNLLSYLPNMFKQIDPINTNDVYQLNYLDLELEYYNKLKAEKRKQNILKKDF